MNLAEFCYEPTKLLYTFRWYFLFVKFMNWKITWHFFSIDSALNLGFQLIKYKKTCAFWLSSDVNHQTKFLSLKIILSTSKMGKIYQFTNSAPQLRARYFLMRSQAISIWWSTLMKNPFKVSSSAELPIIKLWTCTFGICPSNIWKRENSENPRKLFVVQDKVWIYFVGVGKIRIHTFFWKNSYLAHQIQSQIPKLRIMNFTECFDK